MHLLREVEKFLRHFDIPPIEALTISLAGGLIGGASLNAADFIAICSAAR